MRPSLPTHPLPDPGGHFSPVLLAALERTLCAHGCLTAREAHGAIGVGSRSHTYRALNTLVRLGRARSSRIDINRAATVNLYWTAQRPEQLEMFP